MNVTTAPSARGPGMRSPSAASPSNAKRLKSGAKVHMYHGNMSGLVKA